MLIEFFHGLDQFVTEPSDLSVEIGDGTLRDQANPRLGIRQRDRSPVALAAALDGGYGLERGMRRIQQLLPADRNFPPRPNESAAWFFCSTVSDLRVPSQVKLSRTAAIVPRSRSDAADDCCAESERGSSNRDALMRLPFVRNVGCQNENAARSR
ncbi:MAG: hypothetical protein U0935_20330 [Pirellulales bacterium]